MKKKHLPKIRQLFKSVFMLVMVFVWLLCLGRVNPIYASCIALDDVPLDVQEQAAPGIIMFLIDNSGSMDWEFSCPAELQGVFSGYEYVFSDAGDNTSSGGCLEDSTSNKNKWKGQWAGYNRIYYDPAATYTPWPTFSNADLDTPQSDPSKTFTFDLNEVWYDFGDPALDTAALINAGAVFVDNNDSATSQGMAAEVIMDNDNAQNDNLWSGEPLGSFSTSGPTWTSSTSSADFLTNYLYTNVNGSYTATWDFTKLGVGNYDVYATWVSSSNNSNPVRYNINHNGITTPVNVNQKNAPSGPQDTRYNKTWQLLASDLPFNGSGSVVLTHSRTSSSTRASADAIRLVPKFTSSPAVLFETVGPDYNMIYDTTAYKRPQDADATYLRPNATGTYTVTWTANNLVDGQVYDVYALWEPNSGHSTSVTYKTYRSGGTDSITVSHRTGTGNWVKIAGGTSGVTFPNGIGVVKIENHYTSSTTSRICADAVAFVPHAPLNVKIHRAHYYTQNTNGTYLVDIYGGSLAYYKYNDSDNDNIAEANEIQRLDSAQANAAGIVTGRTYTQERQNFANWYQYYRRRELTAKNAISRVINDMSGVYVGFLTINSDIKRHALPVRVTLNNVTEDESATLLTTLFGLSSSGSTPLRTGLKNMGEYFKGAYAKPATMPSANFSSSTYPFFLADKGGTCQQAFAIAMTDGYWNDSYSGVANEDSDGDSNFDGPPFEDGSSDTLADVAMHYYERDLNANLNNDVPINTVDQADFQHMVTYTLSFGVEGTIDRDAYPDCPLGACPTWPAPVANESTTIDDLYHAAINGRGKYINAGNPQEMVDAMNELKQDIQSRLGSSSALATNSIQRQVGTVIYQGTYNTAGWFGEVAALSVNATSGSVGAAVWKASDPGNIPAWDTRNILSYDGANGIDFFANNITTAQEGLLENNGHVASHIVDFIRGDISRDTSHGGALRVRNSLLGDIVHSAPTYYKGVLYIGANDGMLHAIDATNGSEIFCYVPNMIYNHLSDLALPAYSHKYYVDGTPTVSQIKATNQDILVCGLGKGGKGYFALDVTTPTAVSGNNVLWELPLSTDNDMGYAFSNAVIANTEAAGQVVIFGNGYDSVNEKAVLYIIQNPETKTPIIHKLDTQMAGCNGLSTPKVVDVEADGKADYAFAGDLLGNLWKFDLRGASTNDWKAYYNSGSAPQPLITVRNSNTGSFTPPALPPYLQPITAAPEVMLDCVTSSFSTSASGASGLMVIFGTGRYLNSNDFGDTTVQSFYGIWDWGDIWEAKSGYAVAKTKYLGTFGANRLLTNVANKTLLQQTVVGQNIGWVVLSNNVVDWFNPDDNSGTHLGWHFDLPGSGERGIREVTLRMGTAILISTTPSSSPCDAGGSSILYQVSSCTGGRTVAPQFDSNGDGKIDSNDVITLSPLPPLPPTGKRFDQMLLEPLEIGDMLYLPDSQGNITNMLVPNNPTGMFFWRVVQ